MGKFEKALIFGASVIAVGIVYRLVLKNFLPTGIQQLIGL